MLQVLLLLFVANGNGLAQETASDTLAVSEPGSLVFASARLFVGDLLGLSAGNIKQKLLRIAVILLIVVIAKLFLAFIQIGSRWVVYSKWGPLRFVFQNHQRSITVHALLISLAKYVVYFMALGYILNEMGIDYRTYLASLSLIGIAIGFGSQGLVQDVVTGFFILFESQFSVNDMVEISGQVGIVQGIGLRTTRIRNYLGASVILQNRNIPMVLRYPTGTMEAVVDVAIPSQEVARQAGLCLENLGAELEKQFREVIMRRPRLEGPIQLETGELFMRLHVDIWPAQQWVIDAQMVPRIREALKRDSIEIPNDRIVVFYHPPPPSKPSVRTRLRD